MAPLSEREQQILAQLERELDDDVVGRAEAPHGTEPLRGLKLGIVILVAGIMLLVAFFMTGLLIVGTLAFAAMVGGIVLGASSIRSHVAAGDSPRDRVARAVAGWESLLRNRFRKR